MYTIACAMTFFAVFAILSTRRPDKFSPQGIITSSIGGAVIGALLGFCVSMLMLNFKAVVGQVERTESYTLVAMKQADNSAAYVVINGGRQEWTTYTAAVATANGGYTSYSTPLSSAVVVRESSELGGRGVLVVRHNHYVLNETFKNWTWENLLTRHDVDYTYEFTVPIGSVMHSFPRVND